MYQLLTFTLQNNCCEKYALNDIDTSLIFFNTEEHLFDALVNEFRTELELMSDKKTYQFLQFVVSNRYISKNRFCACGKLFVISTKTEDTTISYNKLVQLIDESQISILLDDFHYGSFSEKIISLEEDDDILEPITKKRRTERYN